MVPRSLTVTRSALSPAIVLLALASCTSSPRIDTEAVANADFSSRHTFAWQESVASYDPEPASGDVQEVKQAIHQAVVEQLSLKGYTPAQAGTPDFLVSFHLVVNVTKPEELCTRRHLIFEWPDFQRQLDTYEICQRDPVMSGRTVRKGTLVVFVVDAATRNLLWQGVADGAAVSRRKQVEKLREAVQEMFSEFPGNRA
jgi:hypothetical protein